MKKAIIILCAAILFFACNTQDKDQRPSTALDTGREFIRASLNGDFKKATPLLLQDPENTQLFESYKTWYNRLPAEQKAGYKQAEYTINKYLDVDDSTTIINFSNSYMKKPMDIKIVRRDKLWQVDFKYANSGNLPID